MIFQTLDTIENVTPYAAPSINVDVVGDAGAEAFNIGLAPSACPYASGTMDEALWLDGYEIAQALYDLED
jgi:hypothetical protein